MSDVELPTSPYKGLSPFSVEDAPFFFGREIERKIISANLRTRQLTLLYGPSGVGKSSVINAGVVYHLRQRAKQQQTRGTPPVAAFAGSSIKPGGRPAAPDVRPESVGYPKPATLVVFSNWLEDPLKSLQDAIIAGLQESSGKALHPETEKSLRALKLTEMLEEISVNTGGGELLIILDQFEEYFVYHPTDEGLGKFADEFSRAVVNLNQRANFLISIREDWVSRLDRFRGRIPNLFENSIRIDHLEQNAARDAIVEPIRKYNKIIREQQKEQPEVEITPGFISEVLHQLEELDQPYELGRETLPPESDAKPAERRIQTARLQIVLQHLWDKANTNPPPLLDAKLLSKPDTAKGIFQLHLQEALAPLSRSERISAAYLFPFLITESGSKFASTADGLALRSDRPTDEIRALLTKLSEGEVKIIKQVAPSPEQHNEPRYEITSDVLAAPILKWANDKRAKQERKGVILTAILAGFILGLVVVIIFVAFSLLKVKRQRQEIMAAQTEAETERAKLEGALNVIRSQDELIPYSKAVLRGHATPIMSAFFTSEKHVLTASTDGSAILWDIETKQIVREYSKNQNPLISASSSPQANMAMMGSLESSSQKNMAVMGTLDGRVILWNTHTGESKLLREQAGDHITDVRFSPDGEIVVAATTVGTVIAWKAATGERVKLIGGNRVAIRQLGFSPHGRFLAAASEDHTVRVWNVGDWSERVLKGHTGAVNGLAFSPDEESVATASEDKTVRVWNLSNGSSRVFKEHTASVNSVSFDSDGRRILSASDDKTARIWNLDSMKVVELSGHTDKVLSAAFDPGGTQVVTGSKDTSARIWVANTGWSLAELRGHLKQVTYVAFAPNGKFVLTASDDATARVWYVPRPGDFNLKQPTIDANPKRYVGPCPVTIRFFVTLTAVSGSGTVIYRFKGSDGRIWPIRAQTFNEPGSNYINWYWRINKDYVGSETIEVLEPANIKPQKATFSVKCVKNETATPEPTPEALENP
jgi:WD40 repeat protein